jgi:hypothetical protein
MNLTAFRQASPRPPRVEGSSALSQGDGLHAFDSESEPKPAPPPAPEAASRKFTLRVSTASVLPLAIFGIVGVATGAAGMWLYQRAALARAAGSLKIETSVPGADVLVSGKSVGRTPVMLALAPGAYGVELALNGIRREFTVNLAGGSSVVRHVDLPRAPDSGMEGLGSLLVQTEPAKLIVSVDGVERGRSPLALNGLQPGEHQIAVRADGATLRRTVTIQPNEHTVLVVAPPERSAPATPAQAAGGWLAIASPVSLVIREDGAILGSTEVERLMLPAGEHDLELSNEDLGYQTKRSVKIEAGKTAAIKVEPPKGTLSINAQPWAEVWVDGQRIGETPIGKLPQTIGTHQIVLRHPDLGERREAVTVTLGKPARLGVDMRKK